MERLLLQHSLYKVWLENQRLGGTHALRLTFWFPDSLGGWLHTEVIGSFAVLNGLRPTTNPLYCSNGEIVMHRSFPVTLTSDIRSYPNNLLALSHGGGGAGWGDDCSTSLSVNLNLQRKYSQSHKLQPHHHHLTIEGLFYTLTRPERRSKEEWSAPPSHHLGQKDGSCHHCIDFNELHHMNVMKCYLLPADFHRLWCGARAQRHAKAYHRVSVHGEWKKAFNIPRGYNEYLIMLLSINNAPTVFQIS